MILKNAQNQFNKYLAMVPKLSTTFETVNCEKPILGTGFATFISFSFSTMKTCK